MRKIIFIFFIILFNYEAAFSQCSGVTISPSQPSYCAGEPITVRVNNPSPTTTYRIVIDGVIYSDTVAIVGLPGASTTQDHYIDVQYNVFGNWVSCVLFPPSRPKITVQPSPDPTIIDISPNQSGTGFKQCITAQTYTLNIQNNSSTASAYTQTYTINWGDGNSVGPTTAFDTLSHTYLNPGGYTLTFTVSANELTGACKTVTKTYDLYFGVLPNVGGIGSVGNFIVCAPSTQQYLIDTSITNKNPPGTTYYLTIGNSTVANYAQPIPRAINYLFNESSCGQSCGGDDYYLVRITARNLCGELSSSTCQPVAKNVNPNIIGRDTVCIGNSVSFLNNDPDSKTFVAGRCVTSFHTWRIIPNTGYSSVLPALNIPVQNNALNVTFSQTGHYRITLHDSGYCNVRDTFKDIVVVDRVVAQAAYTAPSCISVSGFLDVPMINSSTAVTDIITYNWTVIPSTGVSFSSGNANSINPVIRFTRSGSYTVRLTVEGTCNTNTWDSTIIIKGKPSIDTLKIPDGCFVPYSFNPKNYFNYTNGGDNNAIFNWTFSNGTPASSSSEDPGNITYSNSGTFPIVLTIQAQCGDSTLTNILTVQNNIKPDAGQDRSVCKSTAPFSLTAIPSGGVWSGNGITNPATGIFNPANVSIGSHNVFYTLNSSGSCPTRDTVRITVVDIVGLTAGQDQTICKGSSTLHLIGNPAFPNGTWFGVGIINDSIGILDPTGIAPGNYQIGYVYGDSTGACTDTAYKTVTIFDSVHISMPSTLCMNQPFNFGNIVGNISAARWNFGDGTPDALIVNPAHTFTRSGNFTVTLFAQTPDACFDTIAIPVTVISSPPLSFIVSPDSSCTGNNILFSFPIGHDTATNYLWNFGPSVVQTTSPTPQSFSFPPPLLGDTLYFVTLSADYFCGTSIYTDTVKVKTAPVANFNVQSTGCSPFVPLLANNSYGSPTNYLWDFGNGQTTTIANPAAPTYINNTRTDTTYTIRLTVSNVCGTDDIQKSITVRGNNVTASFFTNITTGCQPLDVDFFSISSGGTQTIWDFGEGNAAYIDEPIHSYQSAGVFNVKLLVIGVCGRDSAYGNISVLSTPQSSFTVSNPCVHLPAQFLNTTTNANGSIWDFGDGIRSSLTNPTHVYDTVGSYTVKLISSNNNGCMDSVETLIGVYTKPTATFEVNNPVVCQSTPLILINNSTDANNYLWHFGNGETSTIPSPPYVYPDAGSYTISLVAINGQCRDSVFRPAASLVHPKPIAEFLYDFVGNGFDGPVMFTNATVNGSNYVWTFGDGDSSTLKDPTHQYDGYGPYRVTLYAVNDYDCRDTVSHVLGIDYSGQLYVPNVFSPEVGVGESAIFKPKGLSLKEYHLEIFSTFGQLLWETSALENGQPAEGWDGRYKGGILPQDVYVWKIRAIFTDGKAWEGMKDPKTGKSAVMGSLILLR